MNGQQILSDVATKAMETFHRNSDTMVAGYLVRHPDVDPADVALVCRVEKGVFTFRIEPKELHVPPAINESSAPEGEALHHSEYVIGWNACRDAMIAQAKMVKDQDGTIVTLLRDSMPTGNTEPVLELGLAGEVHG